MMSAATSDCKAYVPLDFTGPDGPGENMENGSARAAVAMRVAKTPNRYLIMAVLLVRDVNSDAGGSDCGIVIKRNAPRYGILDCSTESHSPKNTHTTQHLIHHNE